MVDVYKDVAEFHRALKVPVVEKPQFPSDERVQLRVELVQEEVVRELFSAIERRDIVATADGIIDGVYVLVGMALEFGIPFDRVWNEVQRSNMEKVGPNGEIYRRPDGKVTKPPGWNPPNIAGVLADE